MGEQPRRPASGLVVGLVAAALLVAGVTTVAMRGSAPGAAGTAPSATRETEEPGGPDEDAPPLLRAEETREVSGRVLTVDDGTVSVVDLATGDAQPYPGPGAGEANSAVRVGGSVLLHSGRHFGDTGPQPGPLWVARPDLSGAPLPETGTVVPDADGTGYWTSDYAAGRKQSLRHVGLDGRLIGTEVTYSGGGLLFGAYRDGIVVWDVHRGGGTQVLDPGTGLVRHHDLRRQPLGMTADRLVLMPTHCAEDCEVAWFDLPSDFTTGAGCRCGTVLVANGVVRSKLSPDGRWLAMETTYGRGELTVCPLDGGACERPPNAVSYHGFEFAWLGDSSTLLLAMEDTAAQLAAWRPGWDEVRLIPGRHRVDSMAALGT